jgi:hypothetical protein
MVSSGARRAHAQLCMLTGRPRSGHVPTLSALGHSVGMRLPKQWWVRCSAAADRQQAIFRAQASRASNHHLRHYRGIFVTGSSLVGAAVRVPRITSKNLIRCALAQGQEQHEAQGATPGLQPRPWLSHPATAAGRIPELRPAPPCPTAALSSVRRWPFMGSSSPSSCRRSWRMSARRRACTRSPTWQRATLSSRRASHAGCPTWSAGAPGRGRAVAC